MATGFEWTELFLKYSKTVLAGIAFLVGSLGYNIYGNFDKSAVIEEKAKVIEKKEAVIVEKKKEVKATQEQLTNVAEHFYITTKPVKTPSKFAGVPCTAACIKIINEAIKKHEKGRLH